MFYETLKLYSLQTTKKTSDHSITKELISFRTFVGFFWIAEKYFLRKHTLSNIQDSTLSLIIFFFFSDREKVTLVVKEPTNPKKLLSGSTPFHMISRENNSFLQNRSFSFTHFFLQTLIKTLGNGVDRCCGFSVIFQFKIFWVFFF